MNNKDLLYKKLNALRLEVHSSIVDNIVTTVDDLFGQPNGSNPLVSGSLLTFEECLREEFLANTQNYPKEYKDLFHQKFNRAAKRFSEQQ